MPLGKAARLMISQLLEYCSVAVPLVNGVEGGNVLVPVGYGAASEFNTPPVMTW